MNEFLSSKRALKGTIKKCVNDSAMEQDANMNWGGKKERLGNGFWKLILKNDLSLVN